MKFTILLCCVNSFAVGVRISSLGLLWPSMRSYFSLPQDAIGALLLVETAGAIVGTTLFGSLAARFSLEKILLVGGVLVSLGVGCYAFSPTWELFVLGGLASGFGLGSLCSGMNAYLAENERVRIISWVHACFGVGATLTPFIVSFILWLGGNWRAVFFFLLVLLLLETLGLWCSFGRWKLHARTSHQDESQKVSALSLLRMPIAWLLIALCLFYVGLEHTPGTWCFTLFTESRGIEEEAARRWMALYWGTFTIARFILGTLVDSVGRKRSLAAGSSGAILASLLLWAAPFPLLNPVALFLLGLSLATIYPTLLSETPRWVGSRYASYAIGFQSAASGIGSACLPALAGVIIARSSLEIVGGFIFVLALLVAALLSAIMGVGTSSSDA